MNQKHVEITPELYSEMLDEVIRLKRVNAELLAAIKPLLDIAREHDDRGPAHESWQSQRLVQQILAADVAIAHAEGRK